MPKQQFHARGLGVRARSRRGVWLKLIRLLTKETNRVRALARHAALYYHVAFNNRELPGAKHRWRNYQETVRKLDYRKTRLRKLIMENRVQFPLDDWMHLWPEFSLQPEDLDLNEQLRGYD